MGFGERQEMSCSRLVAGEALDRERGGEGRGGGRNSCSRRGSFRQF